FISALAAPPPPHLEYPLGMGSRVRTVRVLRIRASRCDVAAPPCLAVDRRRVRRVLRGPAGVDLLRPLARSAAAIPFAGRHRFPRHLCMPDRRGVDAGPRATG